MAQTAQQAYNDIVAHIAKQGGAYSSWYCGITSNIEERLFGDHKVPKSDHWRVFSDCESSEAARAVEKALLEHGCDGGSGGGDDGAIFVYAYLKTPTTNP